MINRLRTLLRWEDVLLSVVAFLGLPLFDRLIGDGGGSVGSDPAGPTPLIGAFGLIAILGVLACLCTRGPDEPAAFSDGQLTLQGWARFPLMAGVGIVGLETLPGIGLPADPFVGVTFLIVFVTAMAGGILPVVPVAVRRGLVTPMALVATGAFDRIIGGGLGGSLGVMLEGAIRGDGPPEVSAFLPLILAAVAVLYVMLVVAPRAIADPGASGLAWVVRFVLLLVSLVAGDALAGLFG